MSAHFSMKSISDVKPVYQPDEALLKAQRVKQGTGQGFDTGTALKLLDPQGTGISLVPLAEVQQHQSNFFWAAVFFGLFAAVMGSLVSLLTTTYDNSPVIFLLGMFLASYFVFFIVFTTRGMVRWKALKRQSMGPGAPSKESLAERVGALERRIQLFKVHRDLGRFVFNGVYTLSMDEFDQRVDSLLPFEKDDPRRKKFNQKLMSEGIVSVDKSDPDNWTISFEAEYDVTE